MWRISASVYYRLPILLCPSKRATSARLTFTTYVLFEATMERRLRRAK